MKAIFAVLICGLSGTMAHAQLALRYQQVSVSSALPDTLLIMPKEPIVKILRTDMRPFLPGAFATCNYGFFCRQEVKLDKITPLPFRFRLGSVQQTDWLEGKPGTTIPER